MLKITHKPNYSYKLQKRLSQYRIFLGTGFHSSQALSSREAAGGGAEVRAQGRRGSWPADGSAGAEGWPLRVSAPPLTGARPASRRRPGDRGRHQDGRAILIPAETKLQGRCLADRVARPAGLWARDPGGGRLGGSAGAGHKCRLHGQSKQQIHSGKYRQDLSDDLNIYGGVPRLRGMRKQRLATVPPDGGFQRLGLGALQPRGTEP